MTEEEAFSHDNEAVEFPQAQKLTPPGSTAANPRLSAIAAAYKAMDQRSQVSSLQATFKALEQSSQMSSIRAAFKAMEQSSQMSSIQAAFKAMEQNSQMSSVQAAFKAMEQSSQMSSIQAAFKAMEQNSQMSSVQAAFKAMEQNSQISSVQAAFKAMEQNSQMSSIQAAFKAMEQNSQMSSIQAAFKAMEQNSQMSSVQAAFKAMEQSSSMASIRAAFKKFEVPPQISFLQAGIRTLERESRLTAAATALALDKWQVIDSLTVEELLNELTARISDSAEITTKPSDQPVQTSSFQSSLGLSDYFHIEFLPNTPRKHPLTGIPTWILLLWLYVIAPSVFLVVNWESARQGLVDLNARFPQTESLAAIRNFIRTELAGKPGDIRLVKGTNVRLRTGPSMKSEVTLILPADAPVVVLGKEDRTWLFVSYEHQGYMLDGYVSTKFLKKVK
ncbi:SH3 domain-containing protein [Pseudomonas nitroreducens]|uniref:SH3 domain-containing protein n=1 Tax=Pseudomonas nitroreducens TaxID=46680 RepID=UPI003D034A58